MPTTISFKLHYKCNTDTLSNVYRLSKLCQQKILNSLTENNFTCREKWIPKQQEQQLFLKKNRKSKEYIYMLTKNYTNVQGRLPRALKL